MKMNKMLSLGLTLLLGLSGVGLSNGQVVRADTTVVSPVGITYRGQVQNIGWQPYVSDGAEAGTDGKGFRVEALNIKLVNAPAGASILYQGHVQNIGWQSVVSDGAEMGTDGKGLRVEAFKLALAGMPGYSIEYRAHVQNIGWQPWVSDGAEAGTDGKGLRVEAIEIKIVKTADGSTPVPVTFVDVNGNPIGNTTTGSTGNTGSTGGGTTVPTGDSIVTFKDSKLEHEVRVIINKLTGTLYKSDVDNITTLALESSSITDISGIENLTGLTTLDLSINKISDISLLSGLTKLTYLDLGKNQISDITPLKGLVNLKILFLNNDEISDISPLKGLTSLKLLGVENNEISDADIQGLKETLPECSITASVTSTTPINPVTVPTSPITINIPASNLAVTVTASNIIQVKFSNAPADISKVTFNVITEGYTIPFRTSWDSTNTVATLVYGAANLPADTYVVNIKDGATDLGSASLTVMAEQVAAIKISSSILNFLNSDGYAAFQLLDQYGNDVTGSNLEKDITWTCPIGPIIAIGDGGILEVMAPSGSKLPQNTTIKAYDNNNGVSVSATVGVSQEH